MRIQDLFRNFFVHTFIERSAQSKSMRDLIKELQNEGEKLDQKLARAPDSPRNRTQLNHIIGLERWGQSRLHSALGNPLLADEYEGYRPAAELSWDDLRRAFAQTRADTITLTEQLAAQSRPSDHQIPHNQLGPLTIKGWLRYLTNHATRESFLIR